MLYTNLTNKAMQIAHEAHNTGKDMIGNPYVFHPYHLAEQMNTETRVCMALLHDVVEDTDLTLEELRKEFPDEIIAGLDLLTHKEDVDYYDYIKKICRSKDAMFVKVADLIHNMDETRLDGLDIPESQKDRWIIKYAKALEMVTKELEEAIPIYTNSSFEQDKSVYEDLLRQFRYPDRTVLIPYNIEPLDIMTEQEFNILSNKSIEEQKECIIIETEKRVIEDYEYLSKRERGHLYKFSRCEYNRLLLVSKGVIVGSVRVNNQYGTHDKNRVSYILMNKEEEISEYRYIDHSRDHYAVSQDITVCKMFIGKKWGESLYQNHYANR